VAELTSANAVMVTGLYPRKGTVEVGSDADLVVIPKEAAPRRFLPENLARVADYSLYESLSSRGFPRDVVPGGVLAVSDGVATGLNPTGSYLERTAE